MSNIIKSLMKSKDKFIKRDIELFASIEANEIKISDVEIINKDVVKRSLNVLQRNQLSNFTSADTGNAFKNYNMEINKLEAGLSKEEPSLLNTPIAELSKFDISTPETIKSSPNYQVDKQFSKLSVLDSEIRENGNLVSYSYFTLNESIKEKIKKLKELVDFLGGTITSAGGRRSINALKNTRPSMHVVGRAIDLGIHTGLSGKYGEKGSIKYVLEKDTEDVRSGYTIWCPINKKSPQFFSEAYDYIKENIPTLINSSGIRGSYWKYITTVDGVRLGKIEEYIFDGEAFNLTALFNYYGFNRIRPLSNTIISYNNQILYDYRYIEWWHYECHEGMIPGKTIAADILFRIFSYEDVYNAISNPDLFNKRINGVWKSGYFSE